MHRGEEWRKKKGTGFFLSLSLFSILSNSLSLTFSFSLSKTKNPTKTKNPGLLRALLAQPPRRRAPLARPRPPRHEEVPPAAPRVALSRRPRGRRRGGAGLGVEVRAAARGVSGGREAAADEVSRRIRDEGVRRGKEHFVFVCFGGVRERERERTLFPPLPLSTSSSKSKQNKNTKLDRRPPRVRALCTLRQAPRRHRPADGPDGGEADKHHRVGAQRRSAVFPGRAHRVCGGGGAARRGEQ